jgi:hypothetical protein
MKQITCPHCGDTYPDFDVAHVCSRGQYAPKMNKLIAQLAERSGLLGPSSRVGNSHEATEIFANLIISEVLTICEDHGDKGLDGHYCSDAILKRFSS